MISQMDVIGVGSLTIILLTGFFTGGVFALAARGLPFSISAGVGFIALSGVAVLDDMILVSYVRQLQKRGRKLEDAVEEAAITQVQTNAATSAPNVTTR